MKLATLTSNINMMYGPKALSSLPKTEGKEEVDSATPSNIKGKKSSGDKIASSLLAGIGTMIFGYWGVYGTSCAVSQLLGGSIAILPGLFSIGLFAAIGLLGAYVACMSIYSLVTGNPNKILPSGNDTQDIKSKNQPVSVSVLA